MPRSDTRTRRDVEEEVYSDFDIGFGKNPVTGALVRVTNDESVKQSIRNIVLTMVGEWAHHPNLGSKVYRLLFDPLDSITGQMIRDAIMSGLTKEPRATILQVGVATNANQDGYDVTIYFQISNDTSPSTLTMFLKRVR